MLFAHGFGCDQNMWRWVTPAFVREYRIVVFDYVGFGKSDFSDYNASRYNTLDGYARDVLEICAAADLHDVIFVGHSVSCIIGILAAQREPERFSRLILVGPSASYINEPPGYMGGFERADIEGLLELMDKNDLGWASFLAPVVMKNAERPELGKELEQSFCATDPKIARRFAEVTFLSDHRADLAKTKVPALILQCSDDSIAPVTAGRYVERHLAGSVFRQLEAVGHCPHMSHPAEVIRVTREYLGLK